MKKLVNVFIPILILSSLALFIIFPDLVKAPVNTKHNFSTIEQQLVSSFAQDSERERARKHLAVYYNEEDSEMRKGFALILQDDIYLKWQKKNKSKKNFALILLVHLLQEDAYLPGDTISMALAVANNYFYSIADEETKKQIRADLIKHFSYYKKILAWQQKTDLGYDLSLAPIIPKIYWASRQRNLDLLQNLKTININEYKEFVDTIENLEFMHELLITNKLADADSLMGLARNIEQFTEKNIVYRAQIEQHRNKLVKNPLDNNARQAIAEYDHGEYTINFMGKNRRWDLFYWLNYQMRLFREFGYFKGDCTTETTFQMNLYKAAGIPSLANQIRPVRRGDYTHNSPLYYNIFFKKWDTIQFPKEGETDYYVHFEKPIWHHLKYEMDGRKYKSEEREVHSAYWQGEMANWQKIVHFRKRGFTDEHFEQMFLSDITQQSGFIFNSTSAPTLILDSDNDGILDEFEFFYNTDQLSADTDQDGFADLWEIEFGYDPTSPSSIPPNDMIAIDGISFKEADIFQLDVIPDLSGDYTADSEIYDIASIAAQLFEDMIYVAVTYHNDIRKNARDIHTVRIDGKSQKELKRMAFQWVNGKIYVYEVTKTGWNKQESKQHDFSIQTVVDTELLIPLSYFSGFDAIDIKYQATGVKKKKSNNNSDATNRVTIDMK